MHVIFLLILALISVSGMSVDGARAAESQKISLITQKVESKEKSETKYTKQIIEEKKEDIPEKKTGSGEAREDKEKDLSDKKLRQEINTYIIESYKAQGNKIIKDLSNKLTKSLPDPSDRKLAYEKIQSSLALRIEQTRDDTETSAMKKEILIEFLEHLITLLEKKITELE